MNHQKAVQGHNKCHKHDIEIIDISTLQGTKNIESTC